MSGVAARAVERATFGVKEILASAGLSYDALASWRAGRREPTSDSLERLAEAFESHAQELEKQAAALRKNARQ